MLTIGQVITGGHKRFGMWCRRKDDSWSDFELIFEFPDSSHKMYTYGRIVPAKELVFHEEPVDQDEQLDDDARKLGEMDQKDIDVAVAICKDSKFAVDAAGPARWLQNVIDELCARRLIGSEAKLLFDDIREAY